jgi:hypothetical protein
VKVLRILLTCLAVVATLAAIAVLVAIAPPFQTWAAQTALSGKSGVRGTLGSLSAGFGEVDIEDLHLEAGGAVLTLPSLKAKLPLTNAVLRRRFAVQSLVAKGWTLDLSGQGATGSPAQAGGPATQAQAEPAQRAARVFCGILGALSLPVDGSLEGVDIEGEVIFTPFPGKAPAHVHVAVGGGGLGAGREGSFTVDASGSIAEPSLPITAVAAHATISAAMDSSRSVNRLRVAADLTDGSGDPQRGLTLSADVESEPAAHAEAYGVSLGRAGREIAGIEARLPDDTHRLRGTWRINVLDSDLAPYFPDHPLPSSSLAGSGDFDTDPDFAAVHASGLLALKAKHLGVVSGALEPVGEATLEARFEATRNGPTIRVDRLAMSLAGERPVATVNSVRPFAIDGATGTLGPSDRGGDLFDANIQALPLAWLSGLTGPVAVAGGDATGEFLVSAANGAFKLRPKAAFAAAGVTVRSAGSVLARGVDLSLALSGAYSSLGWRLEWAPLSLSAGGRRLARADGTATRDAVADAPVAFSTTWDADLGALAEERASPALAWLTGRLASGTLSATAGASTQVDALVNAFGHDRAHVFSASVHADVDIGGAVSFKGPVRFGSKKGVSEFLLEGATGRDTGGPWIDARLSGGSVALEDMRRLAAPFAGGSGEDGRDQAPFWGDWTGRLAVSLEHLKTDAGELADVGGILMLDRGSIRLEGGRGGPAGHLLTNVAGSLEFDAAAQFPYSLKADAAATQEEAASLLPAPGPGLEPLFEGKFSVSRAFTGKGFNLGDLARRSQEEFRLRSSAGIVRLLKADVADSLQEAPTSTVSDTLATVGSVVGAAVGTKRNVLDSGKTTLSPATEAVLDLTYQVAEIGYDSADITAFQGTDGVIHLVKMEMVSPEVRLQGTGRIDGKNGIPLADQALSVDLRLGAQGKTAELLSKAGLLSARKDELGYSILAQAIHLGGTLAHVDAGQWNDLLVKAATRKPEAAKKGG